MSRSIEIHTLAGAYALNAVTDIERAGFARHLAECEACAVEVAELTETTARLATLTQLAPPPRLRDAVFDQVSRTRQVSAARSGRADRAGRGGAPAWRGRFLSAAAAVIVALAGMGTVWAVQQQRVEDAARQAAHDQQAAIATVLAAGDTQLSTGAVAGGTMTVAVSPSLDEAVVFVRDLDTPPLDSVYQLWMVADGAPTSIGVFSEGQRSGATHVAELGDTARIAVSIEPVGGSPQPTDVVGDVDLPEA